MHIFALRSETDRQQIEEALGVRFAPHDSLYHGGDYWRARLPGSGEEVLIRENIDLLWAPGDPDDERFAYPEHAAYPLLLEVHAESFDGLARLERLPSLKRLSMSASGEGSG